MKTFALIATTLILAACGTQNDGASATKEVDADFPANAMATLATCTPLDVASSPWMKIDFYTDYKSKVQATIDFKPDDVTGSPNTFTKWLATALTLSVPDDNTWVVNGRFSDTEITAKFLANHAGPQNVDIVIKSTGDGSSGAVPHECVAM